MCFCAQVVCVAFCCVFFAGRFSMRFYLSHRRIQNPQQNTLTQSPVPPHQNQTLNHTKNNRNSWLPVPEFAVSALLGEGAAVVLEGQRVLPARAQAAGFEFKYPDLSAALRQVLGK